MGLIVLGRVATIVPVLLGVSIVIFLLMHLAPGDVTQVLLGPMASEAAKQELRAALGLDQPLPVQYLNWLGHVVQGDFGVSIANKREVSDIVFPKLFNTAVLGVAAALLACVTGFLVGVFAAARAHSPGDWISMGVTLVVGSTPPFWLGLLLVLLFALTWRWFPATGMQSIAGDGGVADVLHHLVLPAVATAAYPAAIVTRMVRASMLEILEQTYIKVARAKGMPRRTILRKHALRNAMPPIATICGLQLGYLLSGALFTEVVFAWPGLGNQLYYAIIARDIPTVQAAVLLIALIFVLVNLAVDLLNAYLDPKIRFAAGGAT
jgi:ABC-type dipeptide/oligopeptide/nickel transport system permease component